MSYGLGVFSDSLWRFGFGVESLVFLILVLWFYLVWNGIAKGSDWVISLLWTTYRGLVACSRHGL